MNTSYSLFIVTALPVISYLLKILIFEMAKRNFCYGGITQNNIAVYTIGNKKVFFGNVPGHYTKRNGQTLSLDQLDEEAKKEIAEKSWLEKYLEKHHGIFWIGWPGEFQKENIPFYWEDLPKKEKTGKQNENKGDDLAFWERKEDVPFIRFRETYRIVLDELETKEGNIKLKVGQNITVEVVDAYKAYYAPGNFFMNIKGRFSSALIPYIASMTPEELAKADKETDNSEYVKIIKHLMNDIGHDSIEKTFGIRIVECTWTGQDLTSKSKEVRAASELEYVTNRGNKAKIDNAEADAKARGIIAKSVADATRTEGVAEIEILAKRGEILGNNRNLTEVEMTKNLGNIKGNTVALGVSMLPTLFNDRNNEQKKS